MNPVKWYDPTGAEPETSDPPLKSDQQRQVWFSAMFSVEPRGIPEKLPGTPLTVLWTPRNDGANVVGFARAGAPVASVVLLHQPIGTVEADIIARAERLLGSDWPQVAKEATATMTPIVVAVVKHGILFADELVVSAVYDLSAAWWMTHLGPMKQTLADAARASASAAKMTQDLDLTAEEAATANMLSDHLIDRATAVYTEKAHSTPLRPVVVQAALAIAMAKARIWAEITRSGQGESGGT
jgi:hypothetical protein